MIFLSSSGKFPGPGVGYTPGYSSYGGLSNRPPFVGIQHCRPLRFQNFHHFPILDSNIFFEIYFYGSTQSQSYHSIICIFRNAYALGWVFFFECVKAPNLCRSMSHISIIPRSTVFDRNCAKSFVSIPLTFIFLFVFTRHPSNNILSKRPVQISRRHPMDPQAPTRHGRWPVVMLCYVVFMFFCYVSIAPNS